MRLSEPTSPSVRTLHAGCCLILLAGVSWSLLTPDPFAVVAHGPLRALAYLDDLVLHLGVYAAVSLACFSLAMESERRRAMWLVVALLCLHAIGTEFAQWFIPGRTADPADAAANLAGIALGVSATRSFTRVLRRRIVSVTA